MSLFSNRIKYNENNFELSINLEKNHYFPGETIKAKVQIFSKDVINFNYNSLKISYFIKNIEYWQNGINVKETNNETPGGNNENEDLLKDKNNYFEKMILSKEGIVSNINESYNITNNYLKNGFNITLTIELPKEMNPSFEWYKDDNIYCFSRTILSIHIPDLKLYTYKYLFIQKPQPETISEIMSQKTLGKEALIFFWENDNIKFDIYSNKDSFGINDIFPIEIKIDISQLKSELISINLTLKRKLRFMINGEQSIFLNTSDYTEDLWEEKLVLDKTKKIHDLKYDILLMDKERIINKKKLNFKYDLKMYNKKILTYFMPSYKGNNIKCEYFLKIKSIFNGNNINVNEVTINFDLFHENNKINIEAMNEIDKIFTYINNKIISEKISDNRFNNMINSGYSYSLPDEDMLKKYNSENSTLK